MLTSIRVPAFPAMPSVPAFAPSAVPSAPFFAHSAVPFVPPLGRAARALPTYVPGDARADDLYSVPLPGRLLRLSNRTLDQGAYIRGLSAKRTDAPIDYALELPESASVLWAALSGGTGAAVISLYKPDGVDLHACERVGLDTGTSKGCLLPLRGLFDRGVRTLVARIWAAPKVNGFRNVALSVKAADFGVGATRTDGEDRCAPSGRRDSESTLGVADRPADRPPTARSRRGGPAQLLKRVRIGSDDFLPDERFPKGIVSRMLNGRARTFNRVRIEVPEHASGLVVLASRAGGHFDMHVGGAGIDPADVRPVHQDEDLRQYAVRLGERMGAMSGTTARSGNPRVVAVYIRSSASEGTIEFVAWAT